jgi:hypothetical protein
MSASGCRYSAGPRDRIDFDIIFFSNLDVESGWVFVADSARTQTVSIFKSGPHSDRVDLHFHFETGFGILQLGSDIVLKYVPEKENLT